MRGVTRLENLNLEAVLRWWRNRTGRPLSPPQIHQKIIWMLNNFHKTTSEHWRRTPGTQKGIPFSLKGGHLYLLLPPSLFYLTLWISLGVPGWGEHLRNWLLARLVSLLLTPPLLLARTAWPWCSSSSASTCWLSCLAWTGAFHLSSLLTFPRTALQPSLVRAGEEENVFSFHKTH